MNVDAQFVTPATELVLTLADLGVRSTAVLGLSLGAAWLLRRGSAASRHAVLTAGLLSVPVAAVASWLAGATLVGSSIVPGPALAAWAPWLGAAWLVGVVLAAAPLARSVIALRRVVGTAGEAAWLAHLDGGRARVLVGDVAVPITFGWLRPVVLFPRGAEAWSPAERETALAHELAHVRRRDWPVQIAARLALSLAWFQPLAWIGWRRLLLEAEQAADDGVLQRGVPASTYSEHLLARCAELASLTPAAVAMAPRSASQLERRVRAVLAPVRVRSASAVPVALGVTGALLLGMPLADASSTKEEAAPSCGAPTGPSLDYPTMSTRTGAEAGLRWVTLRVEGMGAMERSVPESAARVIVGNCPYRRTGVELVALLERELPGLVAASSGEAAAGLGRVRDLVALHAGYLEALGVLPLPPPAEGDYLTTYVGDGVLGRGADARFGPARSAVDAIADIVSVMPAEVSDRLGAAQRDLEPDDGNLFSKPLVALYFEELMSVQALEGGGDDGDAAVVLAELVKLLADYSGQGC